MGAAVASQTPLTFTVGYTIGIVAGSLLPDIDEPTSYVGRRSLGMSRKVKEAFGHRGMTHSFIVWAAVASILLFDSRSAFSVGVVLGYLFHIVEDLLSVQGVPLFWPFQAKRYKIPLYRTGGALETIMFYGSFALLVYVGVQHGLFQEWLQSCGALFQSLL
jgi:inner membrane protein